MQHFKFNFPYIRNIVYYTLRYHTVHLPQFVHSVVLHKVCKGNFFLQVKTVLLNITRIVRKFYWHTSACVMLTVSCTPEHVEHCTKIVILEHYLTIYSVYYRVYSYTQNYIVQLCTKKEKSNERNVKKFELSRLRKKF